MTIFEAIALADRLRPNELDPALKLRWLSALDGQIHAELLEAHREQPRPFEGYDGNTELRETRMLVPPPYDELYVLYLVMRIDLEHGELERYNNSAARFNQLWKSFAARYCRTHRPLGVERLRF